MNLIFSADAQWGLGKENGLLFRVPADMRSFKEKTTNGVVIMGRKTLDSLPGGRPLPARINVVLTRSGKLCQASDALLVCRDLQSLAKTLETLAMPTERIWVIGGAEIYRLLLPYCQEAFVTRFLTTGAADCFIENLDEAAGWALAGQGEVQSWEGLAYRFDRYVQRMPAVLE